MSSAQYRDTVKKIPTKYKSCQSEFQQRCPGQCTCDYGTRSNYDHMQFEHYVKGRPEYVPYVQRIPGWK